MATSSVAVPEEASGDTDLGIALGLYLGLVTAPLVVAAVGRLVTGDGAGLYVTVLVAVAVGIGVGTALVRRRRQLLVRLGAHPAKWLLPIPPLALAVAGLLLIAEAQLFSIASLFLGGAAMGVGALVAVMLGTRYAKAASEDEPALAQWRAGWPSARRRRLQALAGGLTALGIGVMAWQYLVDSQAPWLGQVAIAIGVSALTLGSPREFVARPTGIEQQLPVARRLYPWDAFDGYTRTADALVLHRPRGLDLTFALEDLEDRRAVEAAVASHLRAR